MKEFRKMIICFMEQTFIYFLFFILQQKIYCSYKDSNINELINVIGNVELYDNLIKLEGLMLQSLEMDELKLPILNPEIKIYLNMSNFKVVRIISNNEEYDYIIPTSRCNTEDLVKFEYILKEQLVRSYDSKNSNLVKKKNLIVRSLKIIKFMLVPMNFYKKTKKIKESLIELNSLFYYKSKRLNKTLIYHIKYKNWLFQFNKSNYKNIRKKLFTHMPIYTNSDIIEHNDLFFTTNSDINSMKKLDYLSNFYNLGIYNLIGSHFIVLGHFIVLKLALKYFFRYFELGSVKFYSWQNILQFNISDRFKALDLLCNRTVNYEANIKRRKKYLNSNLISPLEECGTLEFLINYFNTYQMELYAYANQINLNVQILLENNHLKDKFFDFMCNNYENCNIYESDKFKNEYNEIVLKKNEKNEFSRGICSKSYGINAFDIYINFLYFIKYYSYYNKNNILYVHLLNLIGILNGDSKAYVSSIYLPGYYNSIETCYMKDKNRKVPNVKDPILNFKKYDSEICQNENNITMLQKFYIYVIEVLKINNISSLIKNMKIFEDYSNFLMHDVNWFTFLLLFRLTSYMSN
ncbi:cytoadherence linked asexual protein, putative [Plasmodium relictum]|uniref:Cytoadherence linked asexual protein, putative n=1 Tax=Plasmodium relictum TaxID=85471 RepID=A0A1J1GKQ7_PLARL|nr:cytoadherence linked asexual protein, putative [Plasmodium relictum]CRG85455.1 cytoadherence linked asexual protein, putative [Plasmodium relictum]